MLLLVWKVNVKGCSIAGEIFMRNISDKYLGEIFMLLLVWKVNVKACSIAREGASEVIKRRNAFSEKAHLKSQAFNIW